MDMTRRKFAEGALTLLGGAFVPGDLFANAPQPALRFGVISDVHIGGRREAAANLDTTLRWLNAQKVDAVLCAGDVAHTGLISELERFAEVWQGVFPKNRAADGRTVAFMMSTGNHEVGLWPGRWNGFSEARLRACAFEYGDNPARTWERLFGEKWELVWRKDVKGFTFIGSQWFSLRPPLAAYLKAHADELGTSRPFFYCQHPHPKDTCYMDGRPVSATGAYDDGFSTRALSAFPNAVAISGHSHFTLADERSVWQGAFTSIGAGCLHEGGYSFAYANASAFWHPSFKQHLMKPLGGPPEWGGDPAGSCFSLYEVHADHLVIHRRSVRFGCPLGPAWVIPLPARSDGPFNFTRQAATGTPPAFPSDATVQITYCPKGHELEGVSFKNRPCVHVTFPTARQMPSGRRVFDYVVTATAANGKAFTRTVLAPDSSRPPEQAGLPGECLFLPEELPARDVVFSVVPRDCFGRAGDSLRAKPFRLVGIDASGEKTTSA